MKYFLILGLFWLLPNSIHAQLGVRAAYVVNHHHYEAETLKEKQWQGYSVSLDYWFRLKNYRVEFLPELQYSRIKAYSNLEPTSSIVQSYFLNSAAFLFNVQIYPFDFEGDCDCPVFSKQGNFFTKGFYIAIAPGIFKPFLPDESKAHAIDLVWGFKGLIGAGLDIGFSDAFTLTPYATFHIYTFQKMQATRLENFGLNDLHVGLRLGYRWQQ